MGAYPTRASGPPPSPQDVCRYRPAKPAAAID
jgi:hypothetical protein